MHWTRAKNNENTAVFDWHITDPTWSESGDLENSFHLKPAKEFWDSKYVAEARISWVLQTFFQSSARSLGVNFSGTPKFIFISCGVFRECDQLLQNLDRFFLVGLETFYF